MADKPQKERDDTKKKMEIEDKRKLLENLGLAGMLLYLTLDTSWKIDVSSFVEYMSYSPNLYRLLDQLIIALDPFISMGNLFSLVFAGCMFLVFQYTKHRRIELILLAFAAAITFKVRSAAMYPLLILLAMTGNPLLLLPMALVKEHGVIIGIIYLLVFRREVSFRKVFLAGAAAFALWLSVVFLLGWTSIPGLPTGLGITSMLQHIQEWSFMTIGLRTLIVLPSIVLLIRDRNSGLFLGLCIIVLIIVADFFEPQHWLAPAVPLSWEAASRKSLNQSLPSIETAS